MDDFSKSPSKFSEVKFGKLFRNFLNKYYENTISKNVILKVLDHRNVLYINTAGYSLYTDIFYDIFTDISGIYSYQTRYGMLHSLGVLLPRNFNYDIVNEPDFICSLINDINKLLVKKIKLIIDFSKEMHINYILNRSLLNKEQLVMSERHKIIFFRNNIKLPDNLIGIIGDFLIKDFSRYFWRLIELSETNLESINVKNAIDLFSKINLIL